MIHTPLYFVKKAPPPLNHSLAAGRLLQPPFTMTHPNPITPRSLYLNQETWWIRITTNNRMFFALPKTKTRGRWSGTIPTTCNCCKSPKSFLNPIVLRIRQCNLHPPSIPNNHNLTLELSTRSSLDSLNTFVSDPQEEQELKKSLIPDDNSPPHGPHHHGSEFSQNTCA